MAPSVAKSRRHVFNILAVLGVMMIFTLNLTGFLDEQFLLNRNDAVHKNVEMELQSALNEYKELQQLNSKAVKDVSQMLQEKMEGSKVLQTVLLYAEDAVKKLLEETSHVS